MPDPRFKALTEQLWRLHCSKSDDYGRDTDPYANVRASTEWGIDGWVGAMVRLSDKVHRLKELAKKGTLTNEPPGESFLDIAAYALIAQRLFEQQYNMELEEERHEQTDLRGPAATTAPGHYSLEQAFGGRRTHNG